MYRLREHHLEVDGATAPELINWENLKTRPLERVTRTILTSAVSLLLLFITAVLIESCQHYQAQMREFSPEIDCQQFKGSQVTQDAAYLDQQRSSEDRKGLMHCYCLEQLTQLHNLDKIEFPDGEYYCNTWLGNYLMSNTLIISLAVGISVVNIVVKEIFRCKEYDRLKYFFTY